jgi:hypothetical protein
VPSEVLRSTHPNHPQFHVSRANFPLPAKPVPQQLIAQLEHHLEPDGRNLIYHETRALIDFTPYIVLPSLGTFSSLLSGPTVAKAVLIDLGANGFYASPKALIDMYAPFVTFDKILIVEPDAMPIPPNYAKLEPIEMTQTRLVLDQDRLAANGTGMLMSQLFSRCKGANFVVIKLDVDDGTRGPTMEWGTLIQILEVLSMSWLRSL